MTAYTYDAKSSTTYTFDAKPSTSYSYDTQQAIANSGSGGGTPIGLLLALTYPGSSGTRTVYSYDNKN